MRPLLEQGKIYKSVPPLYLFNKRSLSKFYNGNEWAFDKYEYYNLFNNIVTSNIELAIPDQDNNIITLKKPSEMEWLRLNSEYLLELKNLTKKSACDSNIVEYVCWLLLKSNNDDLNFKILLENAYDELSYDPDNYSISGSYNMNSITLIIDRIFKRNAVRFMKLLSENPSFTVYSRERKNKDEEYRKFSIGEFLELMQKQFNIVIEQRFKGLGEAKPALLFTTAINPKQRKLIRMNIEDVKAVASTLELLHGKSSEMREARRSLLEDTEISYADIDN